MMAPPTQHLTFDGRQIAFDDDGQQKQGGPVLLAMPGMGDLRSQYRHLRPALNAAGVRVITLDVRGFGETSSKWDDYSAKVVGEDALTVLRHLGISSAYIAGNSFAAGSALWAHHLSKKASGNSSPTIEGAILLGPIVRDLPVSFGMKALMAILFGGPWRRASWMFYWDSLFPTRKPEDHAAIRAQVGDNLKDPTRMAVLMKMLSLSKKDTEEMLRNDDEHCPALVVMGTKDPDFNDPREEVKWIESTLSGKCKCTSLIVEGAGHYPHTEMPDQVAPAVVQFLKR
ncbi:hydrolase [Jaminaea rosea]|uniref:Hydrolase n=1 Tax=Jaminaea rosea TaxID=1569628 RepID=A0A316UKE3_9BASI|nr:hydrolase [Jaminaea rosea]PWN25268.1 hydrolase [Jaminaea rosea]